MAKCPVGDEGKLNPLPSLQWQLLGYMWRYLPDIKSRDITLSTKVCAVKAMVFPVVTYRNESWTIKEGWEPKNWYFQIVVLEKTLESPLDCKGLKPVDPKGSQPWMFIGWTDAETEAPVLWLSDAKSQLIGKDCNAGKDWQQEKGVSEDELVGWHHWLNGHEFEKTMGDSEGHRSLARCHSWGYKESDMT